MNANKVIFKILVLTVDGEGKNQINRLVIQSSKEGFLSKDDVIAVAGHADLLEKYLLEDGYFAMDVNELLTLKQTKPFRTFAVWDKTRFDNKKK